MPFIYNSTNYKLIYSDRKQMGGCLGSGGRQEVSGKAITKGHQKAFVYDGNVYSLDCLMVLGAYTYVKTY